MIDRAWFELLTSRIDAPPAQPRVRLDLNVGAQTYRAVGSVESTLALDLAGAGFPLRDAGSAWQFEFATAEAVNPAFAAVATWLRATGKASAWRNELLEVSDGDGNVVGAIERAAVRPLGIATRAVHLVVHTRDGSVWLQQRAFDKGVDPGLWDTTMGGLISADESVASALERETWEEAGLRLEQVDVPVHFGRYTVRRPLSEGYMVEHIEMYSALAADTVVPVNQDGEVACFLRVARDDLVTRLRADAFTLEAAIVLVHWLESTEPGRVED